MTGNELFRSLFCVQNNSLGWKLKDSLAGGPVFDTYWNKIATLNHNKCDDMALLLNEVISSEDSE